MEITPDVIAALAHLRESARTGRMTETDAHALNALDNAGVFALVDEATGYDIGSAPVVPNGKDPAEWGDLSVSPARF